MATTTMTKKIKKKSKGLAGPMPPTPPNGPGMPPMPGAPPRRRPQLPAPGAMDMMHGGPDGLDSADPAMGLGMGPPSGEDKLADWLANRVYPMNIPGLSFQLRQKVGVAGETTACEWGPEEISGQDPESVAGMIYSSAVEDAKQSQGSVGYMAYAMDGEGNSVSRCFFKPAADDLAGGYDNERGNTPEGHMAQAHRHSEIFMRVAVGQTDSILRHYRDQNKELATHASRAIQLQVQVAEMFQKIQDRGMMRDILLKRIERKEKRKDQVLGYAVQFLPDVLMRIGLVPGQMREVIANAQSLDTILAGLTDDKVQMIGMALTDPKQREVFEKAYVSAKQRAAATAARAATEAAKKGNGGGGQNGAPAAAQEASPFGILHGGQPSNLHNTAHSETQPPLQAPAQSQTQEVSPADQKIMRFFMEMTDDAFEALAVSGQLEDSEVRTLRSMRQKDREVKNGQNGG